MTDIVQYMLNNLPPRVEIMGREFQFQLFINHSHDARVCYTCEEPDPPMVGNKVGFFALVENITTEAELEDALAYVHAVLVTMGLQY